MSSWARVVAIASVAIAACVGDDPSTGLPPVDAGTTPTDAGSTPSADTGSPGPPGDAGATTCFGKPFSTPVPIVLGAR